jgi:4-amino-4-deoxy-L-arabinose transferase-like glycosyltransferase
MSAKREGRVRGAVVVIALLGVVYALLSKVVLRGFPFSGDEYSCLLQAELFARGLFHSPAPPHPELLRVDHVVMDAWVRTKYPPGTSALLALGVRVGAPWLVTPIEAVIALVAMWHTARAHFGERAAMISTWVLGLSPLFAFQAATFYAHVPTIMWLALAFAATSRWFRTRGDFSALLCGAAIGCALLTRPGDAVYFGAALIAFRSRRLVAMALVGAAPFVAAYLAYQAIQFGSPFADGYHAYEPTFRAIYNKVGRHPMSLTYLWDAEQQANHLDYVRALVQDWTVPGTVLVAIAGACAIGKTHPERAMRDFAIAVALLPTFGLLLTVADPDDGARPRYLSITLLSIALLAGPGWDGASRALATLVGPRLARLTGVAAMVLGPVQVGAFVGYRIPEIWVRGGLFQEMEALGIERGVVVVRAEWPTRYARNGPFFDRPVLYLSAAAETTVDEVAALYPGRPIYEATEGRRWKIVRRV